jgi:hypothetical protein
MSVKVSSLRVPPARANAGKKIDTWRMTILDQSYEVPIHMLIKDGEVCFSAAVKSDAMKHLTWSGTDLEDMRVQIERDVEAEAQRIAARDWQPSICVEFERRTPIGRKNLGTSISFTYHDLMQNMSRAIGNQGETEVFEDGRRTLVIQRSHDQAFETSKNDLSAENIRFSAEKDRQVARVILPESDRQALEYLTHALNAFSDGLSDRLRPDLIRMDGVPSSEDLVCILETALRDLEDDISITPAL